MHNLHTENLSLNVPDGTSMAAYAAFPAEEGRYPGIIVFQEAFGVNDHIKDVTGRIAEKGYVAVAPELYHRTAHGFEGAYDDFESVRKHMLAMTDEGLETDIKTIFNWLVNYEKTIPSQVASIGFCMGGRVSFLANIILDLKASVSFYGGRIAETLLDRVENVSAPILMFWGGQDKHIKPEHVKTVNDALLNHDKNYTNVVFSKADHGFFCDRRKSYNPEAAGQAWVLTQEFLNTYVEKK